VFISFSMGVEPVGGQITESGATPDLRLPPQLQSIAALWPPVPNYTEW